MFNFYHGTSTNVDIENIILPPAMTGNLREDFRTKIMDKVFITNSIVSASKFAKKACAKFGGKPVVYQVKPIGDFDNINTNEFITDKARIIKTII